jgi:hypothetical protein
MPAKFSGLRVAAGDVHVFYGPCGGGFGDPLERPAEKVLDDVLDGFCTVEHARAAYGVVLDPVAETVDAAATRALRERMRSTPQPPPAAAEKPRATPRPQAPPARLPEPPRPRAAPQPVATRQGRALAEVLRGLREAHGDAWSFEIVRHSAYGNTIEVVGELRANGSTVRESAAAAGGQGRSLGELLERAANDSLQKCVDTLLRNGR